MNTFNERITLINKIADGQDSDLNQKYKEEKTELWCNEKSLTRYDFYQAANSGLKPNLIITIHNFEYEDQTECEYKGKRYDILRTFVNGNILEMTIGEKVGVR